MADKTQKIAEKLHRILKMEAVKEGRTLQELTEEILWHGLEERSTENTEKSQDKRGKSKN